MGKCEELVLELTTTLRELTLAVRDLTKVTSAALEVAERETAVLDAPTVADLEDGHRRAQAARAARRV
jgi:hypothetical protein